MPDYQLLREIWWLLLGTLLIGFAVMDGFDLGVGMLFRFVGRTDPERRAMLESIEPVWDGNQVWFILGGGAVFAAFPILYAASFSDLYPAMFLLLLAFIIRPVGFTFRNKIADMRWRNAWDWALFAGGALPALLLGVAVGNLFLGVDFHFDELQRPVFTGSFFGLLHPFALLAGLVSVAMMTLHGAAYTALKVGEPMSERASSVAVPAALVYIACFTAAGVWVATGVAGDVIVGRIDPMAPSNPLLKQVTTAPGAWLGNFRSHAALWAIPATALLASLLCAVLLRLRRAGMAFLLSSVVEAGTILTAGVALFPFLMPSATHPAQGLTIWDASSSAKTLLIMLFAVMVFLPLVLMYTAWVFRVLRGRIRLEDVLKHGSTY